jgi:alpha-1,2-mannosyltransferase
MRPIYQRLWLGGAGVGLFLLTMLVGNQFIAPQRAIGTGSIGNDFVAFYTAGTFVREGHPQRLYDIQAVRQFQQHLAGVPGGLGVGPWWNPPFFALPFVALAALPFRSALAIWMSVNVVALLGAMWLLCRMLPPDAGGRRPGWQIWGLVPLLILASMPFVQGYSHGQNTFISLLLLTATVAAWRARRAVTAGLLAGLLFYKPQLAAVVALVMIASLGLRAAIGLAITGLALLLLNLIFLPGTLGDYLHRLPANVHFMQVENTYVWERHATLKAFWRLLLQGRQAGEATRAVVVLTGLSCAAFAAALVWAGLKARAAGFKIDRLIAATIATMPLLMPFFFDYDLMLLAVPAVLLGSELISRPAGPLPAADRWLLGTWSVLFVWLFVNPGVAARVGVNLTVPLLAAVAALLLRRAVQESSGEAMLRYRADAPLAAAA